MRPRRRDHRGLPCIFSSGAAAYIWIIVLGGYGVAKLTINGFTLRDRAGWKRAARAERRVAPAPPAVVFRGSYDMYGFRGPGAGSGHWLGVRAFGGTLGDVGAPLVLCVIYLVSLVLAIGFHPIHVAKARDRIHA